MRNRWTTQLLPTLGVLLLALAAWRRAAQRGDDPLAGVLVGAALVLVVGGVVWWRSRRDDGDRARVTATRPGWSTQAVWADATAGGALRELGALAGKVRGGTRLTLAWSGMQVQVWRGEDVLTTLPWSRVVAVGRTVGHAASTGNPAVELVTDLGVRLVVVPTRGPGGGMLPAPGARVDELVARLRAAREAASAGRTPPDHA